MWTKRLTSGNPEFPDRTSLIHSLLRKLVDEKLVGAWIHFELVSESGWFANLLSGKAPFIEVALNEDDFELNLGISKKLSSQVPAFPESWPEMSRGLRKVPLGDVALLCDWIDMAFNKCSPGSPARKISGWIDGL